MKISKKKKEDKERHSILEEGIDDLTEALKMREKFMTKHTLNARTLNLIGNCYMELDDPIKAEEFYKRALNMKKELVGSEKHWEIPTYYNQMSQVHDRRGMKLEKGFSSFLYKSKAKEEYRKAVEWMEKALKLQEELDVADTEHTATFQRNLANALIGLGEYEKALKYATKCYEKLLKHLGKHPQTVRILYLTGVIHEWRNDVKAACESYEKAFEMEEELPEHNHSIVRERIRNRLQEMYSRLKLKDKEKELKRRIEAIEKGHRDYFLLLEKDYVKDSPCEVWVEYCGIDFQLLRSLPEDIVPALIPFCKDNQDSLLGYMKNWDNDNYGAEQFFSQFPREGYQKLVETLQKFENEFGNTGHILKPIQNGHRIVVQTKLGDVSSELKNIIISVLNENCSKIDLKVLGQTLGLGEEELERTQTAEDIFIFLAERCPSSTLASVFDALRSHREKEVAKKLSEIITAYAQTHGF